MLFFQGVCNSGIASLCVDPSTYIDFLDVNFNSSQDQICISNLMCDPCIYSLDNGSNCLEVSTCRQNCYTSFYNSLEDCYESPTFEECLDRYQFEVQNNDVYNRLEEECCPEQYDILQNCLFSCPQLNLPETNIGQKEFNIEIKIWYTTLLTIQPTGPPNFIIQEDGFGNSDCEFNDPLCFELDFDWIQGEYSYCYEISFTASYTDGSCCRFLNMLCVDKG